MSAKLVSIAMLFLFPALTEAQPPPRCSAPLSETQLTSLVKGSVPPLPIEQNVAVCDIDFDPTDEVIGRLRSAGAPESVLAAIRAATGPTERKRRAEQALWASIEDRQDLGVFEDYLNRYPDGQYAAPRQKYRDLKVASMREEMERAIAAGQWDAADEKIRSLLRVVLADNQIRGWQERMADGREAEQRRGQRIAELRAAIPSYLQTRHWANAEQRIIELLSLAPGDSR